MKNWHCLLAIGLLFFFLPPAKAFGATLILAAIGELIESNHQKDPK